MRRVDLKDALRPKPTPQLKTSKPHKIKVSKDPLPKYIDHDREMRAEVVSMRGEIWQALWRVWELRSRERRDEWERDRLFSGEPWQKPTPKRIHFDWRHEGF